MLVAVLSSYLRISEQVQCHADKDLKEVMALDPLNSFDWQIK